MRCGPGAAGKIDGIVRRSHDAPGKNGVQLHARKCAPVELEGRAGGVDFRRGAVDAAEDVELVVVQVDGDGIVGLIGRALRAKTAGTARMQSRQRARLCEVRRWLSSNDSMNAGRPHAAGKSHLLANYISNFDNNQGNDPQKRLIGDISGILIRVKDHGRELFYGLIRIHVLLHAAQEPIFGLAMMEELEHHGYRIGPGTLYPLLHGLERAGLLKSSPVLREDAGGEFTGLLRGQEGTGEIQRESRRAAPRAA